MSKHNKSYEDFTCSVIFHFCFFHGLVLYPNSISVLNLSIEASYCFPEIHELQSNNPRQMLRICKLTQEGPMGPEKLNFHCNSLLRADEMLMMMEIGMKAEEERQTHKAAPLFQTS